MKRKLGRFFIDNRELRKAIDGDQEARAACCALFGKCVVMEATHRFDRDSIEYLAYCEDFEPREQGVLAPEYLVFMHRHEGFVGAERVVTFDATFKRAG